MLGHASLYFNLHPTPHFWRDALKEKSRYLFIMEKYIWILLKKQVSPWKTLVAGDKQPYQPCSEST